MTGLYDDQLIERLRQGAIGLLEKWDLDPQTNVELLTISENATFRAEEPGETVEVALALGIGDITAFGVIHHDEVVGVPGRPLGEVRHDVRL